MALTLVTDTDSVTESETDSVGDCASAVAWSWMDIRVIF